jgi:hypothetical protein
MKRRAGPLSFDRLIAPHLPFLDVQSIGCLDSKLLHKLASAGCAFALDASAFGESTIAQLSPLRACEQQRG